jgi:hypothetical protein
MIIIIWSAWTNVTATKNYICLSLSLVFLNMTIFHVIAYLATLMPSSSTSSNINIKSLIKIPSPIYFTGLSTSNSSVPRREHHGLQKPTN